MTCLPGRRQLDHDADVAVTGWGPDAARCITETVRAVVEAVADCGPVQPERLVTVALDGEPRRALLAALDEIPFRIDVDGELPVTVETVERDHGGFELTLGMASLERVTTTGAAPKAATHHQLRIDVDDEGCWTAHAVIDV